MKINLGKSLSRAEMKTVLGGGAPLCSAKGQNPEFSATGRCCEGLTPCHLSAGTNYTCQPAGTICYVYPY